MDLKFFTDKDGKKEGIKPKTKFLSCGRGDTAILKKLEIPALKKEWEDIFSLMDKKCLDARQRNTERDNSGQTSNQMIDW